MIFLELHHEIPGDRIVPEFDKLSKYLIEICYRHEASKPYIHLLDHSIRSIKVLERLIYTMFGTRPLTPKSLKNANHILGGYLAKVIQTQHDGQWLKLPDHHIVFAWPHSDAKGKNAYFNPWEHVSEYITSGKSILANYEKYFDAEPALA